MNRIPVKISILLLVVFSSTNAFSQAEFHKIKTLEVSDTVNFAAVDRPGELYVMTQSGQLQRFDSDGKLLSLYKNPPAPTLFDPRDGSRLFAYYRETQHYSYLNPSFEVASSFLLDSAFAIEPWLMCASGDHNIWILDAADWSLKKIDVRHGAVSTEVELMQLANHAKGDVTFMREYQGFLFVLDRNQGILVYSSLGNHIRTISAKGINYFNFLGEELYFPSGNHLTLFNLFTADSRELKLPAAGEFSLLTDERLFVIKGKTVEIFKVVL